MDDLLLERVLVPVDFSTCSERAVRFAGRLAAPHDARVDLLHVYQEPTGMHELEGWWGTLDDVERAQKSLASWIGSQGQGPLNELAVELHRLGVKQVETRLVPGKPAATILQLAPGYSLVVLGTHGRSALRDFFIGSVAERVSRRCPVPVLVVPEAPAPPATT
jgi:nucleotide-binding universal stress UspA family protein